MHTGSHILIVGGGPAGHAAASELRKLGFSGGVSVACGEPYAPYDRPSCSKGVLSGHQLPTDISLDNDLPDVHFRLGRRAQWMDPHRRLVGFSTGETCRYDGLIIATGTHAAVPERVPVGAPGLHVLHTIDDAWSIRQDLRNARRVAIVGGGLTGCEVACTVRALAREAVLVHSGRQLMEKVVGGYVASLVTEAHDAAGTRLRLGRRLSTVDRDHGRWRLWLDDGSTEHADVVIMAVGERPSVSWLADTGIDCSDGVLCDASLRVVGAADVVAAGAVARWPDPHSNDGPRRAAHWIAALEQGRAAARTLLHGGNAAPFTMLPLFWSEQLGLRIQVCGEIDARADVEITQMRPGRRNVARAGVLATYHRGGRAIGVAGINAPRAFTAAAQTLRQQRLQPPVRAIAPAVRRTARPVPTVTGRAALPAGPIDRRNDDPTSLIPRPRHLRAVS
jgi:NAD(P)H-nitrite reductase large subunit